jgi:hypothetical protein
MDDLKKNEKKKHDLRDAPPTSLRDTERDAPTQDPQRTDRGPHTVKPGVGAQAPGQTTRQ